MADLTVRDIRDAIEGLPDDTVVSPRWAEGVGPADSEPGVELIGFVAGKVSPTDDTPRLYVSVAQFYLDDEQEEVLIELLVVMAADTTDEEILLLAESIGVEENRHYYCEPNMDIVFYVPDHQVSSIGPILDENDNVIVYNFGDEVDSTHT